MKVEVVNKLEEIIYYQGSHGIEDYLDEFQTLISNANYTDSCTIVVKFRRDLQTTIQNQITTLLVECLKDIDLTMWFEATRCINQTWQTSKAFQSNYQIISTVLRLLMVDFIFYFLFLLYFIFLHLFLFFSIFRTTWVRVYQSCCHISHNLMA